MMSNENQDAEREPGCRTRTGMPNDNRLSELQTQIFDIFMALDYETVDSLKNAAVHRNRHARRAIEEHFEKKRLQQALIEYDFD